VILPGALPAIFVGLRYALGIMWLTLDRRRNRPGLFRRATAALFIAPADRPISLPFDAFAALYGLTPVEIRIAERIVAGQTQREIAKSLGLAGATVKTYLPQVFGRTNVRGPDPRIRRPA